ncbi:hypothetical protein NIES2101_22510 [Calothrix sp. HK-06]|nr:hypothetical protein NIES2101_22510 [Calothrix sp. HK-06]
MIILENGVGKSATGSHAECVSKFFQAGSVEIEDVDYPGKPYSGGINNSWLFYTSANKNNTFRFTVEEGVSKLILSESEYQKLVDAPLNDAPFEVIVCDGQGFNHRRVV